MTDILREDPVGAARQNGNRSRAQFAQIREARGVVQNVD